MNDLRPRVRRSIPIQYRAGCVCRTVVNQKNLQVGFSLRPNGGKADIVMLDPTRLGTDDRFIRACRTLSPEKIVYISCNPETLSRDLKKFAACGYFAKVAEPVDMFPWTSSIETVVLLSKL